MNAGAAKKKGPQSTTNNKKTEKVTKQQKNAGKSKTQKREEQKARKAAKADVSSMWDSTKASFQKLKNATSNWYGKSMQLIGLESEY